VHDKGAAIIKEMVILHSKRQIMSLMRLITYVHKCHIWNFLIALYKGKNIAPILRVLNAWIRHTVKKTKDGGKKHFAL